jgi:hypothetical protein
MTAADQIVRSAKKVLAMEGRPHMTTQSAANPSRRLETGKIQGIFQKNGSRGRNPRGFIVAKSAICLTNSLLAGTGNSPAPIRENPGSIREAGGAFQRICCEWAFIVARGKPDPAKRRLSPRVRCRRRQTRRDQGRAAWSHGLDSGSASERSGRHGRAAPTSREGRLPRGRTGGTCRPETGARIGAVQADIKRTENPDAVGHSGQRRRR